MLFNVFFDPEVITSAEKEGRLGLSALISILRGYCQNCNIAEIDNWQIHSGIKEALSSLPNSDQRSRIKKLFVQLEKSNRFVDSLDSEGFTDLSPAAIAFNCALLGELDFILTEESQPEDIGSTVECSDFSDYPTTNFESERFKSVVGYPVAEDQYGGDEFFEKFFIKAVRFTKRLEIIDPILGRTAGSNFLFSIKKFVAFLERESRDPDELVIAFHTELNDKPGTAKFLTDSLLSFSRRSKIEVHEYTSRSLPHERYLLTDQVALNIGRGADFLKESNGRNRDIKISLCSLGAIKKLLQDMEMHRVD